VTTSTTTTTLPATTALLQTLSGTGTDSGPQFTVPASAKGWMVFWTYDCTELGDPSTFSVNVVGLYGASANNAEINQSGTGTSGTAIYYDTGTFVLQVTSECDWSYSVDTIPS
jgi:hypothetical protein